MRRMTVATRPTENERLRPIRNKAREHRRSIHDVEFIAIDGEGTGNGRNHKYVLLGIGSDQFVNEEGVRFQQALSALWEANLKHPNAAYVGFYLSYDFAQILKTIPENRARILLTIEGKKARERTKSGPNRTPFPVQYARWEFDILGTKRFKFRPDETEMFMTRDDEPKFKNPHPWMYICDAGPFFQTTFINAINPENWDEDPIVTPEEFATIKEGKDKRESAGLDDDMLRYNALENEAMARLMQRLNRGFVDIGIRLDKDQWFGPGQAAQKWLTGRAATREMMLGCPADCERKHVHFKPRVPWQILDDARRTYFGGWFEVFMHGILPGITYEYDINSAYPAIIAKLPCLLHGKYEYRNREGLTKQYKGYVPKDMERAYQTWLVRRYHAESIVSVTELPPLRDNQIRMVYASVIGSDKHIGAMQHRFQDGDGRIARPSYTTGWFWQHELEASKRAGLIDTAEYIEWWTYTPCKCDPPLGELAELYEKRLEVGKNTSLGKSCKLSYNSAYGKLAQTIGNPRFSNEIYASLITAGCRTMILDAIATHPERSSAVAMVATDAVYFTSPHPSLTVSEQLGEWSGGECTPEKCQSKHECGEKKNLTLFKPGMYWDDKAREAISDGKAPKFKSRGINAKAFSTQISEIDDWFSTWNGTYPQAESDWPSVTFPVSFSMTTPLQALMRNDWDCAGSVDKNTNTQRSIPCDGPYSKRKSDGWFDGTYYRSSPVMLPLRDDGTWEASQPYHKALVISDPEQYEGVTPDGYVGQIIMQTIGVKD
jgi:hypothetical protein